MKARTILNCLFQETPHCTTNKALKLNRILANMLAKMLHAIRKTTSNPMEIWMKKASVQGQVWNSVERACCSIILHKLTLQYMLNKKTDECNSILTSFCTNIMENWI